MTVKIYVEGGGDCKEQHLRCQEGFRKLIEKAGFAGRQPRIIACGGRGKTFDKFAIAVQTAREDEIPILLVDSEDPLDDRFLPEGACLEWEHLRRRDRWNKPEGVTPEQAQFMVTCMETWIMADHDALSSFFGSTLQRNALLPQENLETRSREQVQQALEHATRRCGRDKVYQKGKRSFLVLAHLDPDTLQSHLPYFRRFITTLNACCQSR